MFWYFCSLRFGCFGVSAFCWVCVSVFSEEQSQPHEVFIPTLVRPIKPSEVFRSHGLREKNRVFPKLIQTRRRNETNLIIFGWSKKEKSSEAFFSLFIFWHFWTSWGFIGKLNKKIIDNYSIGDKTEKKLFLLALIESCIIKMACTLRSAIFKSYLLNSVTW